MMFNRFLIYLVLPLLLVSCGGDSHNDSQVNDNNQRIYVSNNIQILDPEIQQQVDISAMISSSEPYQLVELAPLSGQEDDSCLQADIDVINSAIDINIAQDAICKFSYTVQATENANQYASAQLHLISSSAYTPVSASPWSETMTSGDSHPLELNLATKLSDVPTAYQLKEMLLLGSGYAEIDASNSNLIKYMPWHLGGSASTTPVEPGVYRIVYTLESVTNPADLKMGYINILVQSTVSHNLVASSFVYPNSPRLYSDRSYTITLGDSHVHYSDSSSANFQIVNLISNSANLSVSPTASTLDNRSFTFEAKDSGKYWVTYMVSDHLGQQASGVIEFYVFDSITAWNDIYIEEKDVLLTAPLTKAQADALGLTTNSHSDTGYDPAQQIATFDDLMELTKYCGSLGGGVPNKDDLAYLYAAADYQSQLAQWPLELSYLSNANYAPTSDVINLESGAYSTYDSSDSYYATCELYPHLAIVATTRTGRTLSTTSPAVVEVTIADHYGDPFQNERVSFSLHSSSPSTACQVDEAVHTTNASGQLQARIYSTEDATCWILATLLTPEGGTMASNHTEVEFVPSVTPSIDDITLSYDDSSSPGQVTATVSCTNCDPTVTQYRFELDGVLVQQASSSDTYSNIETADLDKYVGVYVTVGNTFCDARYPDGNDCKQAEGKLVSEFIAGSGPSGKATAVVGASGYAFAAVTQSGDVVTWGSSNSGGDSTDVQAELTSENIVSVVGSRHAMAALTENGKVIAWPSTSDGGDISAISGLDSGVVKIFGAEEAFAALKSDGSVISWGNAALGATNGLVPNSTGEKVVDISAAAHAFAALTEGGHIFAWGQALQGGGTPPKTSDISTLWGGWYALTAEDTSGNLYAWGQSDRGGSLPSGFNDGRPIVDVAVGWTDFAALKDNGDNTGSLVCWGVTLWGGDCSSPANPNGGESGGNISLEDVIAETKGAVAALGVDGETMYAFGDRSTGGWFEYLSKNEEATVNHHVNVWNFNEHIAFVSATRGAIAALNDDGDIYTWGQHNSGSEIDQRRGENLDGGFIDIIGGRNAFVASKPDGSIATWGYYANGGVEADSSGTDVFTAVNNTGSAVSFSSTTDSDFDFKVKLEHSGGGGGSGGYTIQEVCKITSITGSSGC